MTSKAIEVYNTYVQGKGNNSIILNRGHCNSVVSVRICYATRHLFVLLCSRVAKLFTHKYKYGNRWHVGIMPTHTQIGSHCTTSTINRNRWPYLRLNLVLRSCTVHCMILFRLSNIILKLLRQNKNKCLCHVNNVLKKDKYYIGWSCVLIRQDERCLA